MKTEKGDIYYTKDGHTNLDYISHQIISYRDNNNIWGQCSGVMVILMQMTPTELEQEGKNGGRPVESFVISRRP